MPKGGYADEEKMILREIETELRSERDSDGSAEAGLPGSLSFGTVLILLRLGRRTIFLAGAVALVAATLLAFLLPASFTAIASFIPPGSNSELSAAALMGQLGSFGGMGGLLENKNRGDLYVAILKSHTIAQKVVERCNLLKVYGLQKESLAEKKLASRSFISVGSKDPVVTIEVTDHSPELARDLAAAYLQALQEASVGFSLTESSQRRLFYEQRLAREKDELANAEVALKQVEEKTGLVAPAGQTDSNIQALAQIQAQITGEQARLAALLHDETDQNPDVLRARSEIASLQSKAAQMESGAEKGFGRLSAAQIPETQLEYIRKAREVKYHEALFDIIAKQYEAARLDEARDAPLQVLDRPAVPDTKSGPPRAIIMAAGLLLGLFGSSAWVLVRASRL